MSRLTDICSGHVTRPLSSALCGLLLLVTMGTQSFGQGTAAAPARAQSAADTHAHVDKVDEYESCVSKIQAAVRLLPDHG